MNKITFMGAGSTVFVRNVLGDCMCSDALKDWEYALYDIDATRLEESYEIISAMNETKGGHARITKHLGVENRKEALRGARFVINAIQVGLYDPCTIIDFEVPKKYGLRQTIGDTLGILIGRRGETLDALQYLTSLQVNKGREGYTRVTLDTENYRAKREDSLRRLAQRMANRAVKTGRRVVLEPMNPYERRVLHTALQNHPAVTTHSEGEEPNRRVVISSTNPVKKNNNYKGKKKPYNNKGGRRSGSRRPQGEGKGQGQNQENREGGEKKPYVFRQNSNREEGENRRRQPRKDSYKGERRQEEKAASNDNIRSEVPRSTPPSEAQDKPLYAKIDLD